MKPSLTFLAKVRDGKVGLKRHYSVRTGGTTKFFGGEKAAQFHAGAGLINMPYSPDAYLGRPSLATLTDKGKAFLEGSNT